MKKGLFILLLGLLSFGSAAAGEKTDSVRIFYRLGYRTIDPAYRDNAKQLERFLQAVKTVQDDGRLQRIVIRSYASPDGTNRANELLSERRAETFKAYLLEHTSVPADKIEQRAEGIAWGMLREMVAASGMQYKDEVVSILDNTPVWIYDEAGRVVDGRKKQLMELRAGEPYRYMYREFFPDLRSSIAATLYFRVEEPEPAEPEPEETPAEPVQPVPEPEPVVETPAVEEPAPVEEPKEEGFRPILAVKTNLLYWAGVMPDFKQYAFVPNLEIEWFFCDRWSLAGEGAYTTRRHDEGEWFGISSWSLEPRWWLKNDGSYRWLYIGAYGQVGDYDVQNEKTDRDGNTGNLWGAGLSAGVAIPFARHWGAEVGIRAGYRHAEGNAYSYEAPDYFLDYTHADNHWGVTGIKVSIYYRFGKSTK